MIGKYTSVRVCFDKRFTTSINFNTQSAFNYLYNTSLNYFRQMTIAVKTRRIDNIAPPITPTSMIMSTPAESLGSALDGVVVLDIICNVVNVAFVLYGPKPA